MSKNNIIIKRGEIMVFGNYPEFRLAIKTKDDSGGEIIDRFNFSEIMGFMHEFLIKELIKHARKK